MMENIKGNGWLVLSRRVGEGIVMIIRGEGECLKTDKKEEEGLNKKPAEIEIEIKVNKIKNGQVSLAIRSGPEVIVIRNELLNQEKKKNKKTRF